MYTKTLNMSLCTVSLKNQIEEKVQKCFGHTKKKDIKKECILHIE